MRLTLKPTALSTDQNGTKSVSTQDSDSSSSPTVRWLFQGGEAAERIASLDWSKTSLGPIDSWPQSLQTVVKLCLGSTSPAAVIWGPQQIQIHNDAYARICQEQEWRSLGQCFAQCWASTWPEASELLARASADEALTVDRQRIFLKEAEGRREERLFSFSFNPVPAESGRVEGVFLLATETTQQSLAERRLGILSELAAMLEEPSEATASLQGLASTLAAHSDDLPFLSIYLLDANGVYATRACSSGLEEDDRVNPKMVDVADTASTGWPFAEAVRRCETVLVDNLPARFERFACGPYLEAIPQALVLPIVVAGLEHPVALAVAGVSPRLPLDDAYRSFYVMLRAAITQLLTRVYTCNETQRWQETNAALSRSEERYRAIVEGQSEMVCRFRVDGTILFANGAYARALGVTREELEGRSFWGFLQSEDQPAVRDLLAQIKPDMPEVNIENRLETAAGYRWTMWSNRGLAFNEQGRPTEVQSVGMDITDRKRTEQALREREEQLRLALQGANAGAWSRDLITGRTFWSQEFLSLYGYGQAAPQRFRDWIASVHPEDREWVKAAFWQRAESEQTEYQQEFRIVHPQRGVRWILALGRLERDPEGRALRISGINIDITERKAVEHALTESEERFRTLADNMSQLAWMAEPNGWIFWYNRRWYEYTGASLEEMQGWHWTEILKPDERDAIAHKARQFWSGGREWEHTFQMRGKDGSYSWFLTRVTPIYNEEGRLIRWFGTNTDITEQRAAEQALKEASRRKDEFLATLAHELRNPLAPLRNSLEVMRLSSDDPTRVAEARAVMERQLAHMVHLIDDLLDLSRISRGRVTLRQERVSLNAVIQQAVELCRPQMEAARHKLSITTPPEPLYVNADPGRLAQVFANLLGNAAKFTNESGEIWLSVERSEAEVVVRVRDTGIGISADLLDKVFEMFTQGDASGQAQDGLGIGLSLVKGLVEMHGGSVEAHSEGHNKGCEFVVRLPAVMEENGERPLEEERSIERSRSHRILVVDDNRDAATSMATMLELMGHKTRTAHDGLEAIDAAEAFRPDIILLDIGMPKLNGYEAAEKIRQKGWARNVLLVALTGWGQAEDRRLSREAGFDFHLVKPVELAALQKLLVADRSEQKT